MVTLTLFFIGAAPMMDLDSCPDFHICPPNYTEIFVACFPDSNIKMLLTAEENTPSTEVDKIHSLTLENRSHPDYSSRSQLTEKETESNEVPQNNHHFSSSHGILLFDKGLIEPALKSLAEEYNLPKDPFRYYI